MKFGTRAFLFFRKCVGKIQVSLKSDKNNRYLNADYFTFMTISRCILLKMRHVSDKSYRETQNGHSMFRNPFPPKISAVYKLMSKNMVESKKPQITIWRMRFACWVRKATRARTHTHADAHGNVSTATMVS